MLQVSHVGDRTVYEQQAYMLFYVRDRRKVVPKKPVDVVLKDNMKPSTNLNRTDSIVNRGLKVNHVQNCKIEKKLNGPFNDELIKESKDSSNVGPSKTIPNEASAQIDTKLASKECLVPETVSMPISSSKEVSQQKTFNKSIIPKSIPAVNLPTLPRRMNNNLHVNSSESSLAKADHIDINPVDRGLVVSVSTSLNLIDANTSANTQAVS